MTEPRTVQTINRRDKIVGIVQHFDLETAKRYARVLYLAPRVIRILEEYERMGHGEYEFRELGVKARRLLRQINGL